MDLHILCLMWRNTLHDSVFFLFAKITLFKREFSSSKYQNVRLILLGKKKLEILTNFTEVQLVLIQDENIG